jgi:hypothetical protein
LRHLSYAGRRYRIITGAGHGCDGGCCWPLEVRGYDSL